MTDLKITDIKPYMNNARLHDTKQIALLAENIKRFGFYPSIEIDENNVIISGHGRLEAARLLGLTKVKISEKAEKGEKYIPVTIRTDLSPEEVKARRIADNRVAEKSEWDLQKIEIEMQDMQPELRQLTGFAIEDIRPDFEPEEEEEPKKNIQKIQSVICPNCSHEFDI